MVTNTRVARELGYLHIDEKDLIDAYDTPDIPDDKIVVLCTGSQGEPMSALARMASGEHKSLRITADDTVIISATPVPGNEKSVQGVINELSKIGCRIFDKTNAQVHVSGHGRQEELKLMLAMTHPHNFMPVHGEAVHLRSHANLALSMGMQPDHIFIANNGDTLEMRNGTVSWGEPVESGVVYVDGLNVTDADPVVLRDRQKLGEDGIVTAVVAIGRRSRQATEVEVSARGVSYANDDEIIAEATDNVRQTIERTAKSDGVTTDQLRKSVRNGLSNFLWSKTHTRPMVIPVVMEV